MKVNNNTKILMCGVVVLIILYYLTTGNSNSPSPGGGGFTVYGTDWCGYTTKQRKHLDTKYGPNSHTYVNCDNDKSQCTGMDGFPVTQTPSGKRVSGFNTTL